LRTTKPIPRLTAFSTGGVATLFLTLELKCPHCHSSTLTRNGKKSKGKQNYQCKDRGRQFLSDHEKPYRGCLSRVVELVKIMLVRGMGIPDISITKVLKVLKSTKHNIKPKRSYYDHLEIDECWTYRGKKENNLWLIYAYQRGSEKIVAFVCGKVDLKTAKKLSKEDKTDRDKL
jgi:predicted RNA-binding Zn-ribbon protein involved in translation (DUF1610 family)